MNKVIAIISIVVVLIIGVLTAVYFDKIKLALSGTQLYLYSDITTAYDNGYTAGTQSLTDEQGLVNVLRLYIESLETENAELSALVEQLQSGESVDLSEYGVEIIGNMILFNNELIGILNNKKYATICTISNYDRFRAWNNDSIEWLSINPADVDLPDYTFLNCPNLTYVAINAVPMGIQQDDNTKNWVIEVPTISANAFISCPNYKFYISSRINGDVWNFSREYICEQFMELNPWVSIDQIEYYERSEDDPVWQYYLTIRNQ